MGHLILLLLFIPLVSFGQDFRKMSFGESVENLKEKYPNIKFDEEKNANIILLGHEDFVNGIKTDIGYIFRDNKFITGLYNFESKGDDGLKNYKSVSEILNDKYEMEENNTWHNDTYKDSPNDHSHSLIMGYVDFAERYAGEDKMIAHTINRVNGELIHIAMYVTTEVANSLIQANEDDF
mgnify:CR=1 FL=1